MFRGYSYTSVMYALALVRPGYLSLAWHSDWAGSLPARGLTCDYGGYGMRSFVGDDSLLSGERPKTIPEISAEHGSLFES